MDYDTTLEHLYRLERFGIKLGLDNIRRLLSLLGDPHHGLKVLHVTGTNGKGSVCAYAASVLEKAGYRVGLYTSPHLVRFNERIQVNRTPITDDDVLRLWSGMQPAIRAMTAARAIDHPTFFEVTTAMAFEDFRAERGGSDLRGQDIRVRGSFGEIDVRTPLLGTFQVENVALAVAALVDLRGPGFSIPEEAIRRGIATARWPGRLDLIGEKPSILVDGAHNRPAAEALAGAITDLLPGRKVLLVVGILNDKDLAGMAAALGPLASRVYACRPKTHRAFDGEEVARVFRLHAESVSIPSVRDAIDASIRGAGSDDIILITGSIYTAGEALDHLGVRP